MVQDSIGISIMCTVLKNQVFEFFLIIKREARILCLTFLKYSLQIATFKCLSVMSPRDDTSIFQHRK